MPHVFIVRMAGKRLNMTVGGGTWLREVMQTPRSQFSIHLTLIAIRSLAKHIGIMSAWPPQKN